MRTIQQTYQDPIDLIWINAADRIGIKIVRDDEVFAAWDGQGTLRIGTSQTLDPDDSLAQMILHELCHALVEGPQAYCKPDWGLDYDNLDDHCHEHACLRLQAKLADRYGLRKFFASTTDFRDYFEKIPADPLAPGNDQAIELAAKGFHNLNESNWLKPIHEALQQTSMIADILKPIAKEDSIWKLG